MTEIFMLADGATDTANGGIGIGLLILAALLIFGGSSGGGRGR